MKGSQTYNTGILILKYIKFFQGLRVFMKLHFFGKKWSEHDPPTLPVIRVILLRTYMNFQKDFLEAV